MKISEIFASLQGEGRYVGAPQVFVRVAGCNLDCSWCDTRYAREGGVELSVGEIMDKVRSYGIPLVCVTGGEPLMQPEELKELIAELKKEGHFVILETNGTLYDADIFLKADSIACDIKPPSSGETYDIKILGKLQEKDYVKVVIDDEEDYEFAKEIVGASPCEVYLQPIKAESAKWLVEAVIGDRIPAKIVPQLHKLVGVK